MKSAVTFASFALAGMVAASPLLSPAAALAGSAKPPSDAVAKISTSAKNDAMVETVDEAFHGLRAIRAARLAIFNGSTDVASGLINEAGKALQTAQSSVKDYGLKTRKQPAANDTYIPFDTSLAISEGFVPTQEKQASLTQANEHLSSGDHQKAAEVLRLAEVDVTVAAALVPANASLDHVKHAAKLMTEKKYYEANLALKAIEDAVIVESYSFDALPVQGSAG